MVAKRVFKYVGYAFAAVGVGATGTAVVSWKLWKRKRDATTTLPDSFILDLDLEGVAIVERKQGGIQSLASLPDGRQQLELRQVVDALQRAGDDPRVRGLFAVLGNVSGVTSGAGLGQSLALAPVQELRAGVQAYRAAAAKRGGAPAIAYADSFGEGGVDGNQPYYLACAFDRVFMQPTGVVSLTGFSVSMPFARRLLDRLGIAPLIYAREEYKSAMAGLVNSGFSQAHRTATQALLDGAARQLVQGVAEGRTLPHKHVQRAMAAAPLAGEVALQERLLDGLKYRDEVVAELQAAADLRAAIVAGAGAQRQDGSAASSADAQPAPHQHAQPERGGSAQREAQLGVRGKLPHVPLRRYIAALERQGGRERQPAEAPPAGQALKQLAAEAARPGGDPNDAPLGTAAPAGSARQSGRPVVALLLAQGAIVSGQGDPRAVRASTQVSSTQLCRDIRAAREDPAVAALVLRVNSPGGSAVASDTIHREVASTVAAGKPVVVSMGAVAASGGYFIAAPATRILALPGTITGSIGVLTGKLDVSGALREAGIDIGSLDAAHSPNAGLVSPLTGVTPPQEAALNGMLDRTYHTFLTRVADGRGMPLDAVRQVARGRVWNGQDALGLGLVDALGGLRDALEVAKAEAGLAGQDVEVREYPRRRTVLADLVGMVLGQPLGGGATAAEASPLAEAAAEVAALAAGAQAAVQLVAAASALSAGVAGAAGMVESAAAGAGEPQMVMAGPLASTATSVQR